MKPTMPMNAFPPGGPPSGPPSGGGWGPPGGGPPSGGQFPPPGPPSGPGFPQQPPKKSRTGLIVGGGCGCLAILGCIITAAFAIPALMGLGPGEEVASVPVTLGQPYAVTYTQDGDQRYEAWLEVDVEYTQGYQLNGNALLSENGNAFGQYTVDEDGEGSPVTERSSATRTSWTHSSVNGDGSSSGNVLLFPIPAKTDGATVTVSGTINATMGTTGTVRLMITERD